MKKLALMFAALALAAAPSFALDVTLTACAGTATFGTTSVPMWGYVSGNVTTCPAAWAPGPTMTIPPGDTALNITLYNRLPAGVSTSIVFPGLRPTALGTPVFFTPPGDSRRRMRSLAAETPSGPTPSVYRFDVTGKSGTFLYHSGTQMQVQVQMGLYGAATKDSAVGNVAYPGITYAGQALLLYSEIDPALHAAVAGGTYGTAAYPSTFKYRPKYFLINGKSFSPSDPPLNSLPTGQTTLLRFVSAALESHLPTLNRGTMTVLAEDANLYPYRRVEQYQVHLAPLKTKDVIVTLAGGDYILYDRALALSTDGAVGGGMYVTLRAGAGTLLANNDTYSVAEDTALNIAAPGVLQNDTGGTLTAIKLTDPAAGTGAVAPFGSNGSFTYTPPANFNGTAQFTYQANNGTTNSNSATVTISVTPVNDPPVAVDDTAAAAPGATVNIPVLANDTDVDPGATLTVTGVTAPTGGTATYTANQVAYTAPATQGTYTFDYTVFDGTASDTGTVRVTVTAVNRAPVAVADAATTMVGTAINIPVLANDTDPDSDPLTLVAPVSATGGTAAINGSQINYTPPATPGTYIITYTISDGATGPAPRPLTATGQVTVTVNPQGNRAPVAVNDAATTYVGAPAFNINVLANDSDPDGNPLTVVQPVTVPAGQGTVTINANQVRYTPRTTAPAYNTVITYTVSDGNLTATGQVVVSVPLNSAPVAANDTATAPLNPGEVVINVLANDTDANNNILASSLSIVAAGPKGDVAVVRISATDYRIRYRAKAGQTGADSFTYRVRDSRGLTSNTATVSVTIQ